MLGFFISDDIIREIISDVSGSVAIPRIDTAKIENVEYLDSITGLDAFFLYTITYRARTFFALSNV